LPFSYPPRQRRSSCSALPFLGVTSVFFSLVRAAAVVKVMMSFSLSPQASVVSPFGPRARLALTRKPSLELSLSPLFFARFVTFLQANICLFSASPLRLTPSTFGKPYRPFPPACILIVKAWSPCNIGFTPFRSSQKEAKLATLLSCDRSDNSLLEFCSHRARRLRVSSGVLVTPNNRCRASKSRPLSTTCPNGVSFFF